MTMSSCTLFSAWAADNEGEGLGEALNVGGLSCPLSGPSSHKGIDRKFQVRLISRLSTDHILSIPPPNFLPLEISINEAPIP